MGMIEIGMNGIIGIGIGMIGIRIIRIRIGLNGIGNKMWIIWIRI